MVLILHIARRDGLGVQFSFRDMSQIGKYGIFLVPSQLSNKFLVKGDRYIIGYYLGSEAVGIYSACYAIAGVVGMVVGPIINVIMPGIVHIAASSNIRRAIEEARRYIKYAACFLLCSIAAAVMLGRFVIETVATVDATNEVFLMFMLIYVGTVFSGIGMVMLQVIKLGERTYNIAIIFFLSAVVNFACNVAMLPSRGILAAGIATFISNAFLLLLLWAYMHIVVHRIDSAVDV